VGYRLGGGLAVWWSKGGEGITWDERRSACNGSPHAPLQNELLGRERG